MMMMLAIQVTSDMKETQIRADHLPLKLLQQST